MFDVPFLRGQAWSVQDDERGADVVVLSREIAEKLYGEANPVGQRLNVMGFPFTIVGVTDKWTPLPRYYKLVGGEQFGDRRGILHPAGERDPPRDHAQRRHELLASARTRASRASCARTAPGSSSGSRPRPAGDRAELQTYIDNYAAEQRKLGA
jgi:putative ABC transport system permease protein